MPEEIELALDPERLAAKLRGFRQGDILDVARMTWLFSPDYPLMPGEVGGVEADEPVKAQSRVWESGLAAIASQTCDLWQLPDVEPFVLLAPLTGLAADAYADASRRMSVRYFAYPEIPGHEELERAALDGRLFVALEKTALLSPHIERVECPLSDPERAQLAFFLGQRLGRPDFPDEIVDELLRPIERGFKRVRGQGFDRFFESVVYIGLAWTPRRSAASVLVLTSHDRRARSKVGDDDVKAVSKRLRNALGHWLKDSSYSATISVHDADQVPAIEILKHHELLLDIEAADFGD